MIFRNKKAVAQRVADKLSGVKVTPNDKPKRWYNKDVFPLIPVWATRPAEEHNTSSFSFTWMFFKLWSMDSVSFEVSFVCDGHWGLGFIGQLPYLRWVVCIPLPYRIQSWMHKYLWRKTKAEKKYGNA